MFYSLKSAKIKNKYCFITLTTISMKNLLMDRIIKKHNIRIRSSSIVPTKKFYNVRQCAFKSIDYPKCMHSYNQ